MPARPANGTRIDEFGPTIPSGTGLSRVSENACRIERNESTGCGAIGLDEVPGHVGEEVDGVERVEADLLPPAPTGSVARFGTVW